MIVISARRPDDDEKNFHVAVTGSGNRGIICANVHVLFGDFAGGTADTGDSVFAKIYDEGTTSAQIPLKHSDAVGTAPARGVPHQTANNVWYFESISDATASAAGFGAKNILAVWAVPAGTGMVPEKLQTINFFGSPATTTDCALFAGGGQAGDSPGRGCLTAATMLATAPLMWTLMTDGFQVGRGLLNGFWNLHLNADAPGHFVWDNGGDGVGTPRVELRAEKPLVTSWRLTLRAGGDTVEYLRPAGEWNPLAANALHHVRNGHPAGAVPPALTVTPG